MGSSTALAGRLILIAEDEPLIAMDLDQTFESAGARVVNAATLRGALIVANDVDLAAAVVDHVLADGDSTELCSRLKDRNIPFIMYSGYPIHDTFSGAHFVPKPAAPGALLSAMSDLLNLAGSSGNANG
jgi:DNA-binding response OmpR family regulator